VQGNSLKPDHVLAAGDRRGNSSRPTAIISDHLPSTPGSVSNSTRQKTSLIYLELQKIQVNISGSTRVYYPFECLCISGITSGARTLREVGELDQHPLAQLMMTISSRSP